MHVFVGVYGGLDLHGKPVDVPWTTLHQTASPGDTSITLSTVVDWEVDNEIVVTPTGYSSWETETFTITDISETDGHSVLTLNASINFRHQGM